MVERAGETWRIPVEILTAEREGTGWAAEVGGRGLLAG